MMSYAKMVFLASMCGTVLSGCAGFTFYTDKELKNKTGIPIYGTKPYVLVKYTDKKDEPISVTIEHLKDPNDVVYARPHSGFGSSTLSLKFDVNGRLTEFGQETDPKISETIESLGGLMTSWATALKTRAEADQVRRGTEQAGINYTSAGKSAVDVSIAMRDAVASKALNGLDGAEIKKIENARDVLKRAGDNLQNPAHLPTAEGDIASIRSVTQTLEEISKKAPADAKRQGALAKVDDWIKTLKLIDKGVQEAIQEAKTTERFELYEIVVDGTGTHLRKLEPQKSP